MKLTLFFLAIGFSVGILSADTSYVLRSDGAYVQFSGMSQDQITKMLNNQNLSAQFMDKDSFAVAVSSALVKQKADKDALPQDPTIKDLQGQLANLKSDVEALKLKVK